MKLFNIIFLVSLVAFFSGLSEQNQSKKDSGLLEANTHLMLVKTARSCRNLLQQVWKKNGHMLPPNFILNLKLTTIIYQRNIKTTTLFNASGQQQIRSSLLAQGPPFMVT